MCQIHIVADPIKPPSFLISQWKHWRQEVVFSNRSKDLCHLYSGQVRLCPSSYTSSVLLERKD